MNHFDIALIHLCQTENLCSEALTNVTAEHISFLQSNLISMLSHDATKSKVETKLFENYSNSLRSFSSLHSCPEKTQYE